MFSICIEHTHTYIYIYIYKEEKRGISLNFSSLESCLFWLRPGETYQAVDTQTREEVAVKVERSDSKKMVLKLEVVALKRLQCIDFFLFSSFLFVVCFSVSLFLSLLLVDTLFFLVLIIDY